jgi:hypothetical protein
LGALATDQQADEAARAIFRVMRVHGSGSVTASSSAQGPVGSAAHDALWQLPPPTVAKAFEQELDEGTQKSRAFLIMVIYGPDEADQRPMLEALAARGPEICRKLVALANLDTAREWAPSELVEQAETRDWALQLLVSFCRNIDVDPDQVEGLVPLLAAQLDRDPPLTVLEALARLAPETPGIAESVIRHIELGAKRGRRYRDMSIQLAILRNLGPSAAPAAPQLLGSLLTERLSDAEIVAVIETLQAIGPAALPELRGLLEFMRAPPSQDYRGGNPRFADEEVRQRLGEAAEAAIAKIEASGVEGSEQGALPVADDPNATAAPSTNAELERMVAIAAAELKDVEVGHRAGLETADRLVKAKIALAQAQARLAEAKDDRGNLMRSLQEVRELTQQLIELTRTQYRAGVSGSDEVFAAEKALLEVQLRMKELGLDPQATVEGE